MLKILSSFEKIVKYCRARAWQERGRRRSHSRRSFIYARIKKNDFPLVLFHSWVGLRNKWSSLKDETSESKPHWVAFRKSDRITILYDELGLHKRPIDSTITESFLRFSNTTENRYRMRETLTRMSNILHSQDVQWESKALLSLHQTLWFQDSKDVDRRCSRASALWTRRWPRSMLLNY